ncbi:UDP-glucosyltransferase 2-like [Schistocerca gregaria]|uniref:UDP-glucosyltransferase 2-like n=1 Tax=Schistocerca gregaria TaxID=7010 RepID=UPI00211DFDC6|nr:UDP-glucosyltransferase 2-like [Schistocerca gregaria]
MEMTHISVGALVLVLMSLSEPCESAKILGLMSTASPSHYHFNRALMLELARRGHQVTVFTPDVEKSPVPNYRLILSERGYEGLREGEEEQFEDLAERSHWYLAKQLFDWGEMCCDHAINSEGGRRLMELTKNETFDLIIAEVMIQECLLGFVHEFGNPPLIGIIAYGSPPWANELVGNFHNPAYVNTYTLQHTDHMTFLQRVHNFVFDTAVGLYRKYHYLPVQDEIARKFFGKSVPPPSEIEKNFQFVMVNSHFSFDYPKPLVPAIIEIGGLQVEPPKPLPKDIKQFLDAATEGVIYMNLGTNIRSDMLKDYQRSAFLEAFAELPYKVLWKFEAEDLPGKPANVKIMKWIPQNDVLAHPNVRVFLAHGGLLGTFETLYHGVPAVVVPYMLDQALNMHKLVAHGVAVELDPLTLTKEKVLDALNRVLKDPSYRENMKRLSAIYRDKPQTALETAVWWTEYALRHQGAPHMRSASLDLYWYQRWLLDIIAFVLLVAASGCAAVYLLVKKLISSLWPNSGKVKTH